MDIRGTIVKRRLERIAAEGPALGAPVPETRQAPLARFGGSGFVICEIKRRSPSRGVINEGMDAVAQASAYRNAGARCVSILTEEDYFGGSLADLMAVKRRFVDLSVLRKDFLLSPEDVDVSFRAGADAVLLIASILDPAVLEAMLRRCRELGLAALVEVHSRDEAIAVQHLRPELVGINARDLATFRVDPLVPLIVKQAITWEAVLVYESGIWSKEQAAFARGAGFHGILVGEAVVRNPALVGELVEGMAAPAVGGFWPEVARRLAGSRSGMPLVKICGITNVEDARQSEACGADMLGFVFADSPRQATPAAVRQVGRTDALKVGVVVGGPDGRLVPPAVAELLAEGQLDAVQLHGDERPADCAALGFPYFKALRPRTTDEARGAADYRSPRVLVDAFSGRARGGTGKPVDGKIVRTVSEDRPLWLAGGLGPGTVGEALAGFGPELVDASSRLEAAPGKKDAVALDAFFREIRETARGVRNVP